jgi:hypothetical protein
MDIADQSDGYIEAVIDDHVAAAMRRVAEIPVGNPGDCCYCGE